MDYFPDQQRIFLNYRITIRAEKLGIRKITAGKQTGIIEFNPKPNIDAAKIIHLVQQNPTIYKIKRSNKLEFRGFADDANAKIEFLQKLFNQL